MSSIIRCASGPARLAADDVRQEQACGRRRFGSAGPICDPPSLRSAPDGGQDDIEARSLCSGTRSAEGSASRTVRLPRHRHLQVKFARLAEGVLAERQLPARRSKPVDSRSTIRLLTSIRTPL